MFQGLTPLAIEFRSFGANAPMQFGVRCRAVVVPMGLEQMGFGVIRHPGTGVPGYTIDVPTALFCK
jgi:hypothetical protein